jgi:hypothetical protein
MTRFGELDERYFDLCGGYDQGTIWGTVRPAQRPSKLNGWIFSVRASGRSSLTLSRGTASATESRPRAFLDLLTMMP